MKWQPGDPEPGDMVRVQIGSIFHYGVYTGGGRIVAFGLPPVPAYASAPDRFLVVETDMDVFCTGRIPEIAVLDRAERRKRVPPAESVRRAKDRLGSDGYHMIRNNCEHFAYECVFGEHRSTQEEAVRRMWNERQILNVYLMRADCIREEAEQYPPARLAQLRRSTDPALRQARAADWALMRRAARHCFSLDPDELRFTPGKHGAWRCDRFFFSLSHADGLVAAAVSNAPVGVDLETAAGLARRFDGEGLDLLRERGFSPREQAAYPRTAEGFACCWTRKEALFKCAGGRAFRPEQYDSLNSQVMTCVIKEECGPILSVCGQNAAQPHLYLTDGTRFRPADWREAGPV